VRRLNGVSTGLDAVPACAQLRRERQVPTRPAPTRASWPCPFGLSQSRLSGGTAVPEAGTFVHHLAPFATLPRTRPCVRPPHLCDPTQLASLVVGDLPRLSQKIVVAPWGALHDELRLLLGLMIDRVVDGSEF